MRQQRRRWWTRAVTIIAALTVVTASLSVVFKLAVDSVPGYRQAIEARAAKELGRPVRIGSLALTWPRLQPRLELLDLALPEADGAIAASAARLRLGFSYLRLLRGDWTPSTVELAGLALELRRDDAGAWSLRGFDFTGGGSSDLFTTLAPFRRIGLSDARVRLAAFGLAPLEARLRSATLNHAGAIYDLDAELAPPATLARRAALQGRFELSPTDPADVHGSLRLVVEQLLGLPGAETLWRDDALPRFDRAGLQAEARIERGRLATVEARLDAARLAAGPGARSALDELHAVARLQMATGESDSGWALRFDRLDYRGARGDEHLAELALSADAQGLQLVAPRLVLDDLAPWLAGLRTAPAAARLADLRGSLEPLRASLPASTDASPATPRRYTLDAKLVEGGLAGSGLQPAFSGLNGALALDERGGTLTLVDTPLNLQLPELFERAIPVEALSGVLRWQQGDTAGDWLLSAGEVSLRGMGAEAGGKASLLLHAGGDAVPYLKLALQLKASDASVLKSFMPLNWGPDVHAWLTRALVRGRVSDGRLDIDSPLLPRDARGHLALPWTLSLSVHDGELAFAPDWPSATGVAAQLLFHDQGLDIEASAGQVGEVVARALHASIPDFYAPLLHIDGRLEGDGAAFYRVLRASPLQARLSGLLTHTELAGPALLQLKLGVPLEHAEPEVSASGRIELHGARLQVRGLDAPITAITGPLNFGADNVHAEALSARLLDTAISARIAPEPASPDGVLSGEFALTPNAPGGLAAAYLPAWLAPQLEGSTQLRFRLPFSGADSGVLSLASELRGVTSHLPAPLAKRAAEALPVNALIDGDEHTPLRLRLKVGDSLRANLRFADEHGASVLRGAAVRLGSGEMPRSDADGLVVDGRIDRLDAGAWLAFVRGASFGDAGLPLKSADIAPQKLLWRSAMLGPLRLRATPTSDGVHASFDGAAHGSLDWTGDSGSSGGGRISARFDSVALEALPPLPAEPDSAPQDAPFDPNTAPILAIDIARLSLGAETLGHLELATTRIADGQNVERLALAGGELDLNASGRWLRRGGDTPGSSAELHFETSTPKIEGLLSAFGYAPNLRAEQAHFSGALSWPRVPAGLELAQAEGKVKLDLKRGALKAFEPGAGRVLGLLNLYALPRRLLFDFRDVVSKGLAFDKLDGNYQLAGGNAETRDLEIVGPSVKVEVSGRIGLATRDYDQKVTVIPDISTGVTLGATLLGGPIGGGIALVAQQLFGKPFNQLGRFSYRVTGSWDNPDVQKGEAAQDSAPPVPAPVEPLPAPEPANGELHG